MQKPIYIFLYNAIKEKETNLSIFIKLRSDFLASVLGLTKAIDIRSRDCVVNQWVK